MREEEDGLLRSVLDLAKLKGWLRAHFRPGQTQCRKCKGTGFLRTGVDCDMCHGTGSDWRTPLQGDPGLHDLILARKPYLIMQEFKSEKGKLSEYQKRWHEEVEGCTIIKSGIWRPSDWQTIVDILS